MLRIIFFGSLGHYSAAHLDALARVHRVVAVVSALESRGMRGLAGRLLRSARLRSDACGDVARRHGISRWFSDRTATHAATLVASLQPDVICTAGYPWLLPPSVWKQPPLGTLNSHGSLLPRHRGLLPLFWIYYHNDTETGVTVHRVNQLADAGEILTQHAYPLMRGFPVDQLNVLNATHGSRILLQALDIVRAGQPCGIPQDDFRTTLAPRVRPGTRMVDVNWDVERVWHFLAGLFPRFIEPLRDADGGAVVYGSVPGYERVAHRQAPGTITRASAGWDLHCTGGVVRLGPPLARRSADRGLHE